eukprot:CAMPEP_0168721472 /NCGR_PEP_ID=MMETSP0724-20121128/2100_1 /TAXON_ID=265536 /ORGANISM="Amphiprora sp., Strain CCMP467" /LENGTH=255 /DNA_ID=CAMNT_0008768115 /DNA_START=47 /DNA_END=814 /DNA_ORIENTATION=-
MSSLTITPVPPSQSYGTKPTVGRNDATTNIVEELDGQSPEVKESVDRMKANLSRFARVSNKKMALRAMLECTFLRNIPLDTTPPLPAHREDWSALEEEVCLTTVQVNGLLFNGSPSSQILKVLRPLCQELCKGLRENSEKIYMESIVRLANSSNSADSYFSLNALLGSQDLVLKPLGETGIVLKGQNAPPEMPPTDLTLYQANGHLHAVLTESTSDVKGKPWISLTARVHERVNLTTGASVRQVQTQILAPPPEL